MPGPLLIFIAAILWGLDGILRRTLFTLPPITIVFYEHLIGAILIFPFFWQAWKTQKLTPREWSAMGTVALFSGVIGTLFFTAALLQVNFIPFSVVFLIQKLQPIFAILMGAIVLGERVSKRFALWAGLALVAGYFVTFPNGMVNTGASGAYIAAAVYAFLAAVCWGSSTSLSRYVLLRHSNTFVTGLRFMITVPIALLFVFGLGALPSLGAISGMQLATLVAIAFSTGMVALWVYYKGLSTTPVAISAIVELAFPMTAVLIDFFLYGTTLAASQYVAAVVLLFAMYRVSRLSSASPTSTT